MPLILHSKPSPCFTSVNSFLACSHEFFLGFTSHLDAWPPKLFTSIALCHMPVPSTLKFLPIVRWRCLSIFFAVFLLVSVLSSNLSMLLSTCFHQLVIHGRLPFYLCLSNELNHIFSFVQPVQSGLGRC